MKPKTRKQAAQELYECMRGYEREGSLSYNTVYRYIYKRGDCWHLQCGYTTSHYNYSTPIY